MSVPGKPSLSGRLAGVSNRIVTVSGRLVAHVLRSPPGIAAGLTLSALVIATVAAWRFAPLPLAAAGSIAALLWAWLAGPWLRGDRRWLEHGSAIATLTAAALLLARHQPTWWPCDIACQGGKGYERLGPLPVVAYAFAATLGLHLALAAGNRGRASVAVGAPRRELPAPLWIQACAWAMIGGACFYLWTSVRLGMACRQCLAFHTTVLAMVGPLRLGGLRTATRAAAMAAGFGALLLAYGPALRVDLEPPQQIVGPQPDDADNRWSARADAGRRFGAADAPMLLELGIDFQCPHCAELDAALMHALAGQVSGGTLRVVIRHVVRAYEPASPALARWAFAAAAQGRHPSFVAAMLGSRAGATADELAGSPSGLAFGVAELEREAAAHQAPVARLVEADKARLSELHFAARTPFAVLLARDGHELGRWSGDLDPAAVARAVDDAAATHAPATP